MWRASSNAIRPGRASEHDRNCDYAICWQYPRAQVNWLRVGLRVVNKQCGRALASELASDRKLATLLTFGGSDDGKVCRELDVQFPLLPFPVSRKHATIEKEKGAPNDDKENNNITS